MLKKMSTQLPPKQKRAATLTAGLWLCSEAEVQLMHICSDQEQVCLVPSRTKYSGWKGNEQAIGG